VSLDQSKKLLSAQRLHQALHCAKPQLEIEIAVNRDSVFELPIAIMCDQLYRARCFARWGHRLLTTGIRKKLFPFGDDVSVLPGHGPPTQIGTEPRTNPFVQ